MNAASALPLTVTTNASPARAGGVPSLCWGAILGGTVAAIGIHILLTALGVGASLAVFTPVTDTNPVAAFSFGAAMVWTVCALIALWFGGLVAGRLSHSLHGGLVHGILVWCLTLILTLLLLSMGTGMILGGALKILGGGLGIGSQAATTELAGALKEGLQRGDAHVVSFVEEAVQSVPANSSPQALTRARRELDFAITRLFSRDNDLTSPANRSAAINALVAYAEMSEAAATKTVEAWTASYQQLQVELKNLKQVSEQKARQTADRAAANLASAAIWSFFALLLGLLAAALGGKCGAACAVRATDTKAGS